MAKKKRRYKKSKKASTLDITVTTLIVSSVLLGVLIYTKSGIVGNKLNEILGGIIGIMQYILPIGMFAVAVKLATDGSRETNSKLLQYVVAILSLAIVFSVFQISTGELETNQETSAILKDAYNYGTQNKGGGALGGLGASVLVKLLGIPGAIIFCIGITIILLVFIFGINLSEMMSNMKDKMEQRRQDRYDEEMYYEQEKEKELEKKETPAQKRKRLRDERKVQHELAKMEKQNNDKEPIENQIKINFDGHVINDDNNKNDKKLKKNQEPKKEEIDPDVLENNLFKDVEEQKQEKKKAVLQLEHAQVVEDEHYEYPPIELLSKPEKKKLKGGAKAFTDTATKLQKTLHSFGVSAKVENVSVGPAITRYELKPAEGVRVSKIANLADDIALNLAAESIRIEAPIPGKQAVGIEVPNKEKEIVHFREVLDSDVFKENKSKLTVGLGKDVAGNIQLADIAKMPHVLIAGATGSGKSVCINTIITSIIYNAKPSEVKFVMVDPKIVELSVYNGIPHLLIPVVTEPRKAAGALAWAVQEMEDRYNKFASKGVRDLKGYNKAIEKENKNEAVKLPQIVIIIDELADLMMVAKNDVEDAVCRLAQKARAAGMHLVIATQRPSVDVITGLIKANIPSRIAFAVSSQVDSRTILDCSGAEKLLGKGDMLFFPSGAPKPSRIQGAFVSDDEVEKVVDFIKANGTAKYSEDILETIENNNKSDKQIDEQSPDDDTDPLLMDAIQLVVENGQASTSLIQRKMKVGYARAGRIIDQMEERGIISGYKGSKPREVLMSLDKLNELKMGTKETT